MIFPIQKLNIIQIKLILKNNSLLCIEQLLLDVFLTENCLTANRIRNMKYLFNIFNNISLILTSDK